MHGDACQSRVPANVALLIFSSSPVNGDAVDRLFKAQVKASLLMEVPYMTLYLNEGQYEAQQQAGAAGMSQ